jgi:hypothetical protein
MEDLDMERLTKLAMDATAGPWVSLLEGRDFTSGDSFIRTAADGDDSDLYIFGGPNNIADQEFIAAARTAVPLLVDEVRRLRALLSDRGE